MEVVGREVLLKYWHIATARLMYIPSIWEKNKSFILSFQWNRSLGHLRYFSLLFSFLACLMLHFSAEDITLFLLHLRTNNVSIKPESKQPYSRQPSWLDSLPLQFKCLPDRLSTCFWSPCIFSYLLVSWTLFWGHQDQKLCILILYPAQRLAQCGPYCQYLANTSRRRNRQFIYFLFHMCFALSQATWW